MKISKHLHSCLLIEENDKTILIDPGDYTIREHALDINTLTKLDYLLYTHEHPDHLDIPFAKQLVAKFPEVTIISNPSVIEILKKVELSEIRLGRKSIKATSTGDDIVSLEVLTHERLWDKEPPQNAVFTVFGKLTLPGDCMSFTTTAEILALPLISPWINTNQAVKKALELQPKVIIPIHDWHWKDAFRISIYERLVSSFKEKGIDFKSMETGETITV